mgnify:CR=1 FL=1
MQPYWQEIMKDVEVQEEEEVEEEEESRRQNRDQIKKNCRRNKYIQFTVLETTLLKATYIDVVVVGKIKKRKGCG